MVKAQVTTVLERWISVVSPDAKSLLGISFCSRTELLFFFVFLINHIMLLAPALPWQLCNKKNVQINSDTKMTGSSSIF